MVLGPKSQRSRSLDILREKSNVLRYVKYRLHNNNLATLVSRSELNVTFLSICSVKVVINF